MVKCGCHPDPDEEACRYNEDGIRYEGLYRDVNPDDEDNENDEDNEDEYGADGGKVEVWMGRVVGGKMVVTEKGGGT